MFSRSLGDEDGQDVVLAVLTGHVSGGVACRVLGEVIRAGVDQCLHGQVRARPRGGGGVQRRHAVLVLAAEIRVVLVQQSDLQ